MSDTAPDTGTTTPVVTTDQLPDTGDATDHKAEAEKWKALARKHEADFKKTARELDGFKQASMSDQEKAVAAAVDAARNEARTETLRTVGSRLVDAEVKAAAAGRAVDVEALLEGLDRSRFLDDEGEPNVKAITAWVDRIAPAPQPGQTLRVDLGQGNRGTGNGAVALNDPLLKDLVAKVGPARQ